MFAEKLKTLRIEKNLSQVDLAKMINLSKNTINAYEKKRAEASIETLVKLADIFECSIDYLVGREDDFGIVQSSATVPALTALESEMLSHFRALDTSSQHKAIGYVYALAH